MNEEMDENNLQTPVVMQVASHEEAKDQNLYKMDLDELESSKDYVIDQIFCGENLTIYALFEISDLSGKKSENHLIEVSDSSTNDEIKFYHRSSYKKSLEEKELNGFKSNYKNYSTDEMERLSAKDTSQMTESFYCLKNYGGQYEVTRGSDDSSDLKVLYSKNQSVGKFKFASKGVNTDIAQCPKLVDDVRKAISISKPFTKGDGKTIEIQAFPPVKSSYELIEMETAPSSSSCGSDVEDYRRHYRKSSPNVLLVPLLMMDEGILNTLKSEDNNQHNKEETFPLSEKVSLGINTDFSCSEFLGPSKGSDKDQESDIEQIRTKRPNPPEDTGNKCKESKANEKKEEDDESESESDLTSKKNILKEIKNLQDKLNILIKSLECSESKNSKPKQLLGDKTPSVTQLAQQSRQPSVQQVESTTKSKPVKRNQRRYDDLPIFSPVTFNTSSTKPLSSKVRKKPSSAERESPTESLPIQAKSTVSILTASVSSIFKTPFAWNENEGKEHSIGGLDKESFSWTNFVMSNKILPISKSDCSLQFRSFTPDSKCAFVSGLRKTLSYELGEEKTDAVGAKKMKCALLKFDGNFKPKNNVRVHSNNENVLSGNITPLNCEKGDEIGKKLKQDVLVVEQKITEDEGLLKVLDKEALVPELKKGNQNDEEGDAKVSYQPPPFSIPSLAFAPKTERVVVNYCNTHGDRNLRKEKSFKKITGQARIKSGLSIDIEPKVSGQVEKPTTPNKNDKKLNTEANPRKEFKNSNLNKSKIPDKINKNVKKETGQSESVKPRQLTWNRPRTSGQSKLHVDKLIKKSPASANEITCNKAQAKPEKEEKLIGKNDQHHLPKTTLQKRDRREREIVSNQNETCDLVQNQIYSHPTSKIKTEECHQNHDFQEKTIPEGKPQTTNLLSESSSIEGASDNLPSVVVELFSKKQSSIADSHTEFDQDFTTGPDTDTSHVGLDETDLTADTEDTDGTLETGVKSVWALTKVLLYGDGTKKFEVLEVSLTPPECSLNNEKLNDQKNG